MSIKLSKSVTFRGAQLFDRMGDKRARGGSIEGVAFKVNAHWNIISLKIK